MRYMVFPHNPMGKHQVWRFLKKKAYGINSGSLCMALPQSQLRMEWMSFQTNKETKNLSNLSSYFHLSFKSILSYTCGWQVILSLLRLFCMSTVCSTFSLLRGMCDHLVRQFFSKTWHQTRSFLGIQGAFCLTGFTFSQTYERHEKLLGIHWSRCCRLGWHQCYELSCRWIYRLCCFSGVG